MISGLSWSSLRASFSLCFVIVCVIYLLRLGDLLKPTIAAFIEANYQELFYAVVSRSWQLLEIYHGWTACNDVTCSPVLDLGYGE
jgi:hypothetical protein